MACFGQTRGVFIVFLVIFCFALVSSVFFHVAEGEQKCFLQEMSNGSEIIGDYWIQLYDEEQDEYLQLQEFNLSVVVEAPDKEDLLQHHSASLVLTQWYGSKGTFNVTVSASGEHRICLQPGFSQRPLSADHMLMTRKTTPSLVYVVSADYVTVKAVHVHIGSVECTTTNNNKLMFLQLKVKQLTDLVQQIQKELDYQRASIDYFYSVTYSTNMWIFWWPILRVIYVVVFVMGFTSI